MLALIVPGLHGSGPDHWQSAWERLRPDCRRIRQASWSHPDRDVWTRRIEAAVEASAGPVVLVGHSLGCAAIVHWAASTRVNPARLSALLVAPCDVERPDMPASIAGFSPLPCHTLPFRSTLVASSNDPYATAERARCFAQRWGSALVEVGAQGHINADSRLGAWDFGQVLLESLLRPSPGDPARYARIAALRDRALAAVGTPCDGPL